MRILIVSDAWEPQVNGVVRTLKTTRDTLISEGHAAEVIGPDRFRSLPCPTATKELFEKRAHRVLERCCARDCLLPL